MGGGVRKHIIDLLKNIDKQRYKIYFMYSSIRADDVFKEEIKRLSKNIELIENNYMIREVSLKNDLKAFNQIKKLIKKIKPDIVHCHSSKAGALGRLAAKIMGVKKIYYTPHAYIMQNQNIGNKKKFVFSTIEKILSKCCTTKTFNVSQGEKQFAITNKIDREDKFEVIYNGIDDNDVEVNGRELKKELGLKEDDIIIGVAARLDEQKDPWTFYNIAKEIIRQYNHVKFIYIGDGIYKKEIEEDIVNNKLEDNVILIGFRNDVERLLKIFDIYLITSLYEGMPYSLIEALKARLPIVATNTTGNNEIVIDKYNGLLFEVGNVEEGKDKLKSLLEGKYDLIKMGENSYKLFKEKFILRKMINQLEDIYMN
jgi:glycosyltransferase involved in cell wall biosynthesis